MDALTRRQFDRAMFAKERTLAIRVGDYASRDIKEASFEYGYIKGDTYKPGGTCAGSGKITFTSIITTFNKLDVLHPEIGLLVGNTYQWVKMGEYFINDIEIDRNRNTTTLELMDGMFKLNREYVTDLHFPAEVREVIQEVCLKTGIELANDYFGISAMRYHVEQAPEGKKLSFRDMLSSMTQMIGMSCFFNREGKMEIRDLTESNITINADSYFLHGLTKSEIEYQIAGITCKTDKKPLTVGMKTGRSLELENVFMTQSALNDLYYKLKNLTYYPYNLNYQGHLLLEVGQWVTIQTNKKETFKVPVLSQSFTFKGGLRGRISADSKAGNDTQYSYEGTITKQIKQQDGIEAKIQAQIEAADKDFDQKVDKIKKDFNDQVELAKAKVEEVKQDISSEIDKRFQNFDNASIQEARRKAEEALKSAGVSASLAQEAKKISDQAKSEVANLKTSSQTAIDQIEDFKSQYGTKLNEFKSTADGLSTKMGAIETYVNNDGQRQDDLKRYAREESASQARAVREDVTRDFVGKNTFQESVQGVERRLESLSLGTSGNLLKNSNDGFYNQHDKRYRLVETLQANQTYTLVTKYWNGENATGHSFLDGLGNWRFLTYNPAIDAWMLQFTPTKEIPAGTEIVLSSDPYNSLGNMDWATLVRGAIPLIHWQPARGDVEEGVTQKLAEYKETIDGRFAMISSQINGKVNQSDFQRVKETSQLYERIIGRNENDIADKVSRMALTNQLFQVEVSKATRGGRNYIKNGRFKEGSKHWIEHQSVNFGLNFNYQHSSGNRNRTGLHIYHEAQDVADYFGVQQMFSFDGYRGEQVSLSLFVSKDGGAPSSLKVGLHYIKNDIIVGQEWKDIPNGNIPWEKYKRFTFSYSLWDDVDSIRLMFYGERAKDINLYITDVQFERGSVATDYKEAPEDTEEAIRTVQKQLAGSWSVQNINSAGDLISGINLGANGHNRFDGKLTHITGETLIDNAVIKSAMIDKLKTANFESGSVTTTILDAEAVTADKLKVDNALIRKITANEAFIDQLTSKRIFATKVESVITSSTVLEGYKGWIGGFQLGTHDLGSGHWLTGRNHFSVGMGDGEGGSGRTALWVNWGYDWNSPGYYAWFVKNNGKMYCYNTAEFWNTPIVNGDLKVTGNIIYNGGAWIYSNEYVKIGRSSTYYFYLEKANRARDYFLVSNDTSDRRLKSNIQESSVSGIDIINRLKTYSYRKEFNNEVEDISCGIMAQDVQKYAPDAFRESPDGVYTYNTFALVPYLIKAIQELNQKIEKMEKTIA